MTMSPSQYLPPPQTNVSPLPVSDPTQLQTDPWEKEAGREGFYKDLTLNVQDLLSSVSSGADIDPEFLRILQKDIDTLRHVYEIRKVSHQSSEWADLGKENGHLQEVAVRMKDLASKAGVGGSSTVSRASSPSFDEDEVFPLIGKIDDPLHLPCDYDHPAYKGLQILHDEKYAVRRVKGNGHCLFSSMAAHLITEARLSSLQTKLPLMKAQGWLGDIDPSGIIGDALRKIKEGASVESILQKDDVYKEWIVFLRTLATKWWEKQLGQEERREHLAHAAREVLPALKENENDKEVCMTYLRSMASMDEHKYGGEPEIFALQNILGINIHTIDAANLGKAGSQAEIDAILPKFADLSEIWLLYRSSHFDALYLSEQVK